MANTSNISGDAIDAIRPDLEAFASLWTALRVTYGGTNITKTIARLLHMYQPEDGIQAYERLLKTLFVLLEDFDSNGLRLLVSMVPPPKGSSDEIIREVFFKATGFVRCDAPIFHQNYSLLTSMANPMDEEMKKEIANENIVGQSIRQKIPIKLKNVDSSEAIPRSESLPVLTPDCSFRGFPSTEIYSQSVQGHNSGQYFVSDCHSDQSTNFSLNGYKMNWLQAPYCFQNGNTRQSNSSYRDMLVKTMDNKYLRVPVGHCNPNMHYFNRPCQMVLSDRNVQSKDRHTITSGLLMNSSQSQISDESFEKPEDKERCAKGIDVETHSDLNEHNYNLPKKDEEKSEEINRKKYENHIRNEIYKMDVIDCDNYVPMSMEDCVIENLTPGNNLVESIKSFLKRAENDESLDITETATEFGKNSTNEMSRKNSRDRKLSQSETLKSMEQNSSHIVNETKNFANETNDTSYNFIHQSNSMSELAAYKRQYYDALFNIQRAKMAVANSLILSPIQSRNDYDSYHSDNLQQHHWIFQQPQRLVVGPSYAQRFVQPEYSEIHNPCIRSSDWMSTYPLSRVAQENPLMHHTSYDSRLVYSNHAQMSQINNSIPVEMKIEAKKRKLENIVVKLKENEINNIHN